MTTTVLDETFSDSTTVAVNSRDASVGGPWFSIEVINGNGLDTARVIGGSGNAFANSGAAQSGNRTGLLLTTADWDIYFEVVRPAGIFGGLVLYGGANTSGAEGWALLLDNFNDNIRLFSDSVSFATLGTERRNVSHVMPTGASIYQLRKRGADLSMFRNGVQLGTTWTDPDPTTGSGVVAFRAAPSDNLAISRVWATIEAGGTNGNAGGANLVAAASLIAGSASGPAGTLAFQAAGLEFGRRTGLALSTFGLDAAVNYRYTVHADGLVLGAAIFTSPIVSTDSSGRLPNVTNAAFITGQTVWVCAVRQADGQRAIFPMVVA